MGLQTELVIRSSGKPFECVCPGSALGYLICEKNVRGEYTQVGIGMLVVELKTRGW